MPYNGCLRVTEAYSRGSREKGEITQKHTLGSMHHRTQGVDKKPITTYLLAVEMAYYFRDMRHGALPSSDFAQLPHIARVDMIGRKSGSRTSAKMHAYEAICAHARHVSGN